MLVRPLVVENAATFDTVALLEIHQTLLNDSGVMNSALLQTLSKAGVKHLYLIGDRTLNSEIEGKYPAAWSFANILKFLQEQGFRVHGVITRADPVYNQGVGAVYRDIISKHAMSLQRNRRPLGSYARDCYNHYCQRSEVAEQAKKKGYGDVKGLLMEYFLREKPAAVKTCFYFDDTERCLQAVKEAAKKQDRAKVIALDSTQESFPVLLKTCYENHPKKLLLELEKAILGGKEEPLQQWKTGLFGWGWGERMNVSVRNHGQSVSQGQSRVTHTMRQLLQRIEQVMREVKALENQPESALQTEVCYRRAMLEVQALLQKAQHENNSWSAYFTRDRAAMAFYAEWNEKLNVLIPAQQHPGVRVRRG